jgi:hypothetical protein
MTTTTTIIDLEQARALARRLQRKHDELGNGRDCRSDNERAVWYASRRELTSVIHGLLNDDLDKPMRLLAEAQATRTAVIEKQAEIEQQLSVHPVSLPDRASIDREHDRQRHLRLQLERLRRGELWSGPGTTFPQLSYLDQRIAELTEKVDRLQRRHAAFVAQAVALLGVADTVTAGADMGNEPAGSEQT